MLHPVDEAPPAGPPFRGTPAPPVRIVHLTAEYWPLARTGGLGEAVQGMAASQAGRRPTAVVLPLYRAVRESGARLERVGMPFGVRLGQSSERAQLWAVAGGLDGVRVFLVEHDGFFNRPGIYGENEDYPDNARRFGYLTRATLQALPAIAPGPVILHAHDWHAALAPLYLRTTHRGRPKLHDVATVLTVHNAAFQGHFPPEVLDTIGVPRHLNDPRWLAWHGRINWLKGGLAFTDAATAVSPTHAHELRTEVGGFGLHNAFIALGDRFVGVLNGISQGLWDPATDRFIAARYDAANLAGKAVCKAALQAMYGLTVRPDIPLFAMSVRLAAQKGFDIILDSRMLRADGVQAVFLGTGEERYCRALAALAAAAPGRVAVDFAFRERREHDVLAGADILLMPSLYEPCGLTQMRAQRYGTIPVARRVGGLTDTIRDGETGILFDEYSAVVLDRAMERALALYRDPAVWQHHMGLAMSQDFSWTRSTRCLDEVYGRAFEHRAHSRSRPSKQNRRVGALRTLARHAGVAA